MSDKTWKGRLQDAKAQMERLPRLRVGFGGADIEGGHEVVPESIIRHKALAILDELIAACDEALP